MQQSFPTSLTQKEQPMTAGTHRTKSPRGGKGGSGRPVHPPGLRSIIRSWRSLSPSAQKAIANIVASTSGVQTAMQATGTPAEPYSTNPAIQALFDALTPAERELFGSRWFFSGKLPTPYIQGRADGSLGHPVRFDGTSLQEGDGSGIWRTIRKIAASQQ